MNNFMFFFLLFPLRHQPYVALLRCRLSFTSHQRRHIAKIWYQDSCTTHVFCMLHLGTWLWNVDQILVAILRIAFSSLDMRLSYMISSMLQLFNPINAYHFLLINQYFNRTFSSSIFHSSHSFFTSVIYVSSSASIQYCSIWKSLFNYQSGN